jgi:hypothetical protein
LRLRNAFGDRFVSTAAAKPIIITVKVIASALSAAPTKAKLQSLQAKGISWNYSAVIGKSASPLSGTMGRPILVAQLMQSNLETS